MSIEPDTKDWTWVLHDRCPECGLRATDIEVAQVPGLVQASVPRWLAALERADAAERPDPTRWSVIEYACHVRDVLDLFAQRIVLVLAEDDPVFANWDQDATALERDYRRQDPALVGAELGDAADRAAVAFGRLRPPDEERPARRGNGSQFTARSLAQYFWHDVEHHLHDVRA